MRLSTTLVIVLALILLAATPVRAAVDMEVPISLKAQGTLPGLPTVGDTYRFQATAGTILKASVSGKGLALALALRDPYGNLVDVSNLASYRDSGSKVKFSKLTLDETGRWSLEVTSSVAGPYVLKISGKAQKKAGGNLGVSAMGSRLFPFSAPVGSTVSIKVKAAKKSPVQPRFRMFDGLDLTDLGIIKSNSHAVVIEDVSGGDLTVQVMNLASSGGDVILKIKIKSPKVTKDKLDLRADSLGDIPDGGTAVGRDIDAAITGVVEVEDESSIIDGARAVIPGGSMTADTRITISTAKPLTPPPGWQSAGPTVAFGPSGTTFSDPARLTLPYDPDLVAPGSTAEDLRVYHVDENGDSRILVLASYDLVRYQVTVKASSFSRFMPIGPKGPASLSGRLYWSVFLDIFFEPDPDYEPGLDESPYDSQERSLRASRGRMDFEHFSRSGSARVETFDMTWGHRENEFSGVEEGYLMTEESGESALIEWSRSGDDILLEEDGMPLLVSSDGHILIGGSASDPDSSEVSDPPLGTQLELMIERSKDLPTRSELAGTYTFVEFFFELNQLGEDAVLTVASSQAFGTITLKKDKKLVAEFVERRVTRTPGEFRSVGFDSGEGKEKWSIVEGGLFAGAVDVGGTLLLPSRDRNLLVGMNFVIEDRVHRSEPLAVRGVQLLVGVRQSTDLTDEEAVGDFRSRGLEIVPVAFGLAPGEEQPDLFDLVDIRPTAIGGRARMYSHLGFRVDHIAREVMWDEDAPGGVRVEGTEVLARHGNYDLLPTGVITPSTLLGIVSPDAQFGVIYEDPMRGGENVGMTLLLK